MYMDGWILDIRYELAVFYVQRQDCSQDECSYSYYLTHPWRGFEVIGGDGALCRSDGHHISCIIYSPQRRHSSLSSIIYCHSFNKQMYLYCSGLCGMSITAWILKQRTEPYSVPQMKPLYDSHSNARPKFRQNFHIDKTHYKRWLYFYLLALKLELILKIILLP